MKNIDYQGILYGIIALICLIGAGLFVTRGRAPSSVETTGGRYCSAAGIFTNIKPIQSHRSYCLRSDSNGKTYSVNTPIYPERSRRNEYSFSVVDDRGDTLKNFAITHTKPMHVIVVRKDLQYFQHIHPEFNQATGVFIFKDLTFPADGVYRIFADFAPGGGQQHAMGMSLPVTISEDVSVGAGSQYIVKPLGSEEKVKTFNGYRISLSSDQPLVAGREVMLMFNLRQDGRPITDLQQYLGALGHSIILREDSLDFIHAHPMEDSNRPQTGEVGFMVNFPESGRYKIFTQFQRGGKVFTTDFVVAVAKD